MVASSLIVVITSIVKFQDAFGSLVASTQVVKTIQQDQAGAAAERALIMSQLKRANRNLYKLCKKNGIYPVELEDNQ